MGLQIKLKTETERYLVLSETGSFLYLFIWFIVRWALTSVSHIGLEITLYIYVVHTASMGYAMESAFEYGKFTRIKQVLKTFSSLDF